MSYIYKITNKLNGKIYIGKTDTHTVEERFKEHYEDSKRERCKNRPLYRAFNKYGIENFKIEEIEKCKIEDSCEREKYWIEYYGSFKYGYNATLGGDGKAYIDRDLVVKTYQEIQNQKEVARLLKISNDSVRNILKEKNIKSKTSAEISKELKSKPVAMLDKKTNEILKVFSSIREAEKFLNLNYNSHISDVCKGKRKSSNGYFWKFL